MPGPPIVLSEQAAKTLAEIIRWWRGRPDVPGGHTPQPDGKNWQTVKALSTTTGVVTERDGYEGTWVDGVDTVQVLGVGGTMTAGDRYPAFQTGYDASDRPQFVAFVTGGAGAMSSSACGGSAISGYSAGSVQVLGHNASGTCTWYNVSACAADTDDGIISLNSLTAATQTFADVDDTNVTLAISSATSTHTFTMGWSGTLALTRGGLGADHSAATGLIRISGGSSTVVQGSAYTQTYSDTTTTVENLTSSTLTDDSGGTANTTVQALSNPADSPADADALRDDLVANLIPELRNNFADIVAQINALRADLENAKKVQNAVIDDLQADNYLT